MPDLADLFPGFRSEWVNTSIGRMFARVGGSGPPLLLLHGFPQTNVMWHLVAPALAERFTLVLPDLPGYGWSAAPKGGAHHAPYNKRAMAGVMIELMERIGFVRFRLAGHDRGARVGYRLALDHPERLVSLAVLDIIPTCEVWRAIDRRVAVRMWHWSFMAQPYPEPETMIGRAPAEFIDTLLPRGTKAKDIAVFDSRALAHYRAYFQDPARIHANCEDYRAGQSTDVEADEADRQAGKKIPVPFLGLWSATGFPDAAAPLAIWRGWANDVSGLTVESGHYLAEENPDATAAALLEFFLR